MPSLAQVTVDLLDALGLPRVDVVGHDWGAERGMDTGRLARRADPLADRGVGAAPVPLGSVVLPLRSVDGAASSLRSARSASTASRLHSSA